MAWIRRWCRISRLLNLIGSPRMNKSYIVTEIIIRVLLLILFCILEFSEPHKRPIHREELWKYSNPHHGNTVSTLILIPLSTLLPALVVVLTYLLSKDKKDLVHGLLALSLCIALNSVVTNIIKLSVGRPRPDFFFRCFPDGVISDDMECSGNYDDIIEGRKSFPSGHSSWMFTGFAFLSLYTAGKLQCFTAEGKAQSWRLIVVLSPLVTATVVALTRIQDNMHHWEDVTVGSLIGVVMATIGYLHHYPWPTSANSMTAYTKGLESSSDILPTTQSVPQFSDIKNL